MTHREDRPRRITGRAIRKVVLELAARDGNRCCLCSLPIDIDLPGTAKLGPTIEHRIPWSLGGTDDLDNLALAHHVCNSRRGTRPPAELGTTSRKWL